MLWNASNRIHYWKQIFCEGDLLKFVLMVKQEFWTVHPDFWERTNQIAQGLWSKVGDMYDSWHETIEPDVRQTYAIFLERKPG